MSTQSYTTNQQTTRPSWPRHWVLAIGAAIAVAFLALTLALWHAHSSAVPATGTSGTSSSTSVPVQPHAPVNPAVPVRPTVNPAVPATPGTAGGQGGSTSGN